MAQCIRSVLCIKNQPSKGQSLNLSCDNDKVADNIAWLPSELHMLNSPTHYQELKTCCVCLLFAATNHFSPDFFFKSCSVIKLLSILVKLCCFVSFLYFFFFSRTSPKFFPKILLIAISIPNNLESKVFHGLEASEIFIAFLWRVS